MTGFGVALACLAIAGGACGDDDDPATTSTTTREDTTLTEPAKPTAERRELERRLREALRAQGQADVVEIECVITELRQSLSNRTAGNATAALEAGEEVPRAAIDAAFEAGERCRRTGP